jgi:Beta-1,3-glucanase
VDAPYSIPAPGDVAAFQPGGADADYMTSYAASVGATETTQEVFGCSGGGSPDLSGDPSLCAALNRCVAQFSTTVQDTPSDYYQNAPCNYYSWFWHSVAVNGLQYGFAYDDDNGQSSDFNSTDAQYVQVAVGW